MSQSNENTTQPALSCANCRFRQAAERSPSSFLGKLWTLHTAICPGWKRYVKALKERGEAAPAMGSGRGLWNN